MPFRSSGAATAPRGVCLQSGSLERSYLWHQLLSDRLASLKLTPFLASLAGQSESLSRELTLSLCPCAAQQLTPAADTLGLAARLELDSRQSDQDLEREILLAMFASPVRFSFPSLDEFESAVRMRMNIVRAARKTRLQFEAYTAERPPEYWVYDEDRGFLLRPGKSLLDGLREATQPSNPAHRYSFSCWRATEHVQLLAMVQEISVCNPDLYRRISRQSETRALKAANFERVYLRDHGTAKEPLPCRYFVPGDRTWFRNPDPVSADITGFEGSFTFYLGGGEFAEFWRHGRPFTLESKCLTIYFWREGICTLPDGEPGMDEAKVERLVEQTLANPDAAKPILEQMIQLQAHPESFDGGALEVFRKVPRYVCPGTADIVLPDAPDPVARVTAERSAVRRV